MTLKQKWAATCMPKMRSTADDTSSAVTSSSHDTWQGIEPVNCPDVTSEEVREGRGGREGEYKLYKGPAYCNYSKMMTCNNNTMLRLLLSILTALSYSKSAS